MGQGTQPAHAGRPTSVPWSMGAWWWRAVVKSNLTKVVGSRGFPWRPGDENVSTPKESKISVQTKTRMPTFTTDTRLSFGRRTDTQNAVYPGRGVLLSHEKEGSPCRHTDGPRRQQR